MCENKLLKIRQFGIVTFIVLEFACVSIYIASLQEELPSQDPVKVVASGSTSGADTRPRRARKRVSVKGFHSFPLLLSHWDAKHQIIKHTIRYEFFKPNFF